eukprot:CAMPEP_0183751820 /NCGR_PEP_ID=MMETSP0739-20130205/1968_1 /TAXON_ID=385413 /ORGANISM="Thalassiosira miniscula, Strain CCMP1093" /LENGTH=288 /DNA_ID=CAMNT_0025988097 /DNA_START=67 /DNA_END=933 /DNA_ORIENTATION=+
MVLPIKKRFTSICIENDGPAPGDPDPLSAVVKSAHLAQLAITTTSNPEGMMVSTSSTRAKDSSNNDNEKSSAAQSFPQVAQAEVNSCLGTFSHHKQAKPFPDILMDILSNPQYVDIVSWLPHGKSFAIHDSHKFSTEILPKYFRRVIFRSFVRKLNRWGFRSVKRSGVPGLRSTFEHKYFCRDQPKLCSKMHCKSSGANKIAVTKNTKEGTKAVISPCNSLPGVHDAVTQVRSEASHNEDFPVQLGHGLILQELRQREMQQNRQQALMQLSRGEILSKLVELEILRRF